MRGMLRCQGGGPFSGFAQLLAMATEARASASTRVNVDVGGARATRTLGDVLRVVAAADEYSYVNATETETATLVEIVDAAGAGLLQALASRLESIDERKLTLGHALGLAACVSGARAVDADAPPATGGDQLDVARACMGAATTPTAAAAATTAAGGDAGHAATSSPTGDRVTGAPPTGAVASAPPTGGQRQATVISRWLTQAMRGVTALET